MASNRNADRLKPKSSVAAGGSWPLATSPAETAPLPEEARLASIDLLRGIVMVLMALDHTRDFFSVAGLDIRDVDDPALFLTRWITHVCAPVFVFLAGTSAFLHGARGRTPAQLSRFLFIRGLWLVLLEVTVVRFAWTFSVVPDFVMLQVLWVLGISMIVLAGLIHLPRPAIAAIGIGMIAAHNLFDAIRAEDLGHLGWLWSVLHQPLRLHPAPDLVVYPLYSLIPWIGVMAAGYALGPVMLLAPEQRRRRLAGLGVAVTAAFLALRAVNLYGDPTPWAWHDHPAATALSFVNTEKYPPSALFLAMTLGPALLALAAFDGARGPLARAFMIFGRAPLFYYVAHLLLLQCLALMYGIALLGGLAVLFEGLPEGPVAKPEGYGLTLPGIYVLWLLVVAALYLPCRWFSGMKSRRSGGWLSYL